MRTPTTLTPTTLTPTTLTLATLTLATLALAVAMVAPAAAVAQDESRGSHPDLFRQLDELLPTPTAYRTASGAPGAAYWQQRADYVISVELDDEERSITGSETVTYHNESPDTLRYLWVQLDQNIFRADSDSALTSGTSRLDSMSYNRLRSLLERPEFDGGMKVSSVTDAGGNPLDHTIVKTMMRIDLPEPLRTGESVTFSIDWSYNINDTSVLRSRTGFEYFEEDGNCIYEIAHWFPRMAAYTDVHGWQHKQFLGSGEFTLEFGNYLVRITVPDDHVVSATGELQNRDEVLTEEQRTRLESAWGAESPVFVVTPEEAEANEASEPEGKKTWIFQARNVRDFAFATSRKFIWDAQGAKIAGRPVLAMSFYPNEGEPLWSRYSTHAILHTIEVYSKYAFPYPYPVAQSVNGPVGGMEYPMICFNGPRPEKDGTYSSRSKYGLISVIIHEVGHNYFPMIVNSDERQWTWMDEGVNTFLQFLAEQEWEDEYPGRRGEPKYITRYMASERQMPVMTNSESLLQFGSNAYAKPAAALNVLRETVLGRELFDFAFREYANRWMFKRPEPADLFRTLEDASGIDLDWFWRGWFFTTEHVDQAVTGLRLFTIDTRDPDVENARKQREREEEPVTKTRERNAPLEKRVDRFPQLLDFYNDYDELEVTEKDRKAYEKLLADLSDWEKELLSSELLFYVVDLENQGGIPMPVILEIGHDDGSTREIRIPAEVWRRSPTSVSKLIVSERPIATVTLDPHLEIADVDRSDNHYPPRVDEERIRLTKPRWRSGRNPMQEAKREGDEELTSSPREKGEGDDAKDGRGSERDDG